MVRVIEIWDEARSIIGNEKEPFIFRRLTDAVELLSIKGDWDPLLLTLDVCTRGRFVTLPPEVDTILACNMCGHPAIARDEFFQFHINGPGTCGWGYWGGSEFGPEIRYEWCDLNNDCTYRDIPHPDKLYALCSEADDVNCDFWIRGFDRANNVLRTQLPGGAWRDGVQIPVFRSVTALPTDAKTVGRITAVEKSITAGPIKLWTAGQVLLGVYQGNETAPLYRKIQLSKSINWVRIRFRKRTTLVTSKYDLLPVNNAPSVLMMLRALKAYATPGGLAEGEGYEATAMRWMTEAQFVHNPPVAAPMQVLNSAPLLDSWNYME